MKHKNCYTRYFYFFKIVSGGIISLFFSGCVPNNDSSEELSGNYFYRNEGTHVKDILCHLPNQGEVYSEVIGYNFNSDFIVVAQKPIYKEYKTMIGFNLRDNKSKYPTNSEKEVVQSENEADSILRNNPSYLLIFAHKLNYWIIVTKKRELHGPLSKAEYQYKRKILNVPDNLQIVYGK